MILDSLIPSLVLTHVILFNSVTLGTELDLMCSYQ